MEFTLAGLIRDFSDRMDRGPREKPLPQIENLRRRVYLIRFMQLKSGTCMYPSG